MESDFIQLVRIGVWISVRSLKHRRFQTIITSICIAIGVAATVLTLHMGMTGQSLLKEELSGMGLGSILISPKQGSDGLAESDLLHLNCHAGVQAVTPVQSIYTSAYMRQMTAKTMVFGIGANAPEVVSMDLLYGRQFNEGDIRQNNPVCIIDIKTAQNFYKRENIVGKTVHLQINQRKYPYTVIGVVESGGALFQNGFGDMIPNFIYIPYTAMLDAQNTDGLKQVALAIDEKTDVSELTEEIIEFLNKAHQNSKYTVQHLASQQQSLLKILTLATWVIGGIAAVSLLVAGVCMTAVMTLSIKERIREIGIKKSLGAQRNIILWEYWCEAFSISILGSFMGAGISILLLGIADIFVPVQWNISLILLIIAGAGLIGSFFGISPAISASCMDPVESLRDI